jgi:hypothetical protein
MPVKKKKKTKGQKKVEVVMREFHRGTLRDSHGKIVTKRSQAQAIGMSEAGLSKKKKGAKYGKKKVTKKRTAKKGVRKKSTRKKRTSKRKTRRSGAEFRIAGHRNR